MKKCQRVLLVIGVVFSCLLCIVNIFLAVEIPSKGANIFTAISGWVSGVATVILGVVAVVQNKKYKEENDDNVKKQYDFELFKLIIHQREQYISRITVLLQNYVTQFDYKRIIPIIEEIGALYHPQFKHTQTVELKGKLDFFYRELSSINAQLVQFINTDLVLSTEKEDILESLKKYETTVLSNKFFAENMINPAILNLHQQIGKPYENLKETAQKYLDYIYNDLINSIIEKATDIEFIKRKYIKQMPQNN